MMSQTTEPKVADRNPPTHRTRADPVADPSAQRHPKAGLGLGNGACLVNLWPPSRPFGGRIMVRRGGGLPVLVLVLPSWPRCGGDLEDVEERGQASSRSVAG